MEFRFLERELAPARFFERAAVAGGGGYAGVVEAEEEGVEAAAGRDVADRDHADDGAEG